MDLFANKSGIEMSSARVGCGRTSCENERSSLTKFNSSTKSIYLFLILVITQITTKVPPVKLFQLPPQTHNQQATSEQSVSSSQNYETQCLACIRNVTSVGVDLNKRCEGYFCGSYQFSYQYWAEAGKPGRNDGVREFDKCARDTSCAESTVKAYFKRYKRDCNHDGQIDCLDLAALHKAGPTSCSQDWFFKSRYWQAFAKTKCATDRDPTSVTKESNTPTSEPAKSTLDNKNTKTPAMIMKNQTLTSECIDCICESLSSCSGGSSSITSASNCGSGTICGPFSISQSYWKDGRKPGASWTACTRTKECSIVTIRNYMDKHKRDCNGDGLITCEDYAAVHRRGPKSCMNRDLHKEQYWTKFTNCRANQKPKDDASLVRAGDESNDQQSSTSAGMSDKGSSVDVQSGASVSRTTPIRIQSTFVATTTQTPVLWTTMSTTQSQTSARSDRPNQVDENRFVISTVDSASDIVSNDGVRVHHSSLSPYDTYELSPISIVPQHSADKAESHSSTFQTFTPAQHNYENSHPSIKQDDQLGDGIHNDPQRASPSASSMADTSLLISYSTQPISVSSSSSSSNSENGDHISPSIAMSHEHDQQPSVGDEYNSLPTIIVGKPLGAQSTSRISQPPPVQMASSFAQSDGNYPIEQQRQPTRVMSQKPTTSSMQAAATTTRPSNSFSQGNSTVFDQSSSAGTNSLPMTTKSNNPIRSTMLMNQEEPIDADYLVHDLGPTGFDRVVNGIVANPDFSKSYPPMPDHLVQQRKQLTSTSVQPPRRPTLQMHRKEQTSSTTPNHRNNARDPSQSESLDGKRESGKKDNKNPTLSKGNELDQNGDPTIQKVQSSPNPLSGASDASGFNATNLSGLDGISLNETSRIPSECLDCICDASSNCDPAVQCISKQREKNRCGLYMISWNQYKESDIELVNLMSPPLNTSPGKSAEDQDEKLYYECSTDKSCAEKLIHLYIEKYSKDCNNDGIIDCFDFAALHRVGPDQCNSDKFLQSQYWRDFNHCYATDRLTTTIMAQQTG